LPRRRRTCWAGRAPGYRAGHRRQAARRCARTPLPGALPGPQL